MRCIHAGVDCHIFDDVVDCWYIGKSACNTAEMLRTFGAPFTRKGGKATL